MNKRQPLVSVVIPVFNGRNFILPCIESVLQQDYPRYEVIVVDDGSTDRTADAVRQFGPAVRCVRQPNKGTACARNRGIELSEGEYIAFLDHDDLWLPEKLSFQVKQTVRHPKPDIVFTHLLQFKDASLSEDERKRIVINENPVPGMSPSTALVRREIFETVGRFTPGVYLEWPEWYMRAVQTDARVVMIDKVLAKRRVHKDNKGRTRSDSRKDYVRLVKAALDRNRQKKRNGISLIHKEDILRLDP